LTRCPEFWDKWDKEPNFCGLSPQSISEIKGYLELREKIVSKGVSKAAFYERCPSGACRPLLRLADDGTRTDATNHIIACLKKGDKITQETLKGFIVKKLKKSDACEITSDNVGTSTQMRTDVKPLTQPGPDHPNHGQWAPQPGTVPVTDAPPMESLGSRLATCEEPPVSKPSPFQTAAQLKAHEADPLGVDQMFQKPADIEPAPMVKTEKELFMDACQQAYEHSKPDFRQEIDELMQYHPSWKNPGTVIYFCVTNPKEALTGRKS